MAVFLTGVPCLRVGAVPRSFPAAAGSTTLTDFLVGSVAAAAVAVDPLIFAVGVFTAVADIFTDHHGGGGREQVVELRAIRSRRKYSLYLTPNPTGITERIAPNYGNFSFFLTAAVAVAFGNENRRKKNTHTEPTTDLLLFTAAFFFLFLRSNVVS